MAKSKKEAVPEDEAVIMEQLKQGFKRLLGTPPETHKEMVERRRGRDKVKRGRKDQQ